MPPGNVTETIVSRLKTLAWTLIIGLCAIAAFRGVSFAAPQPGSGVVDFAAPAAIIELRGKLTPDRAEADGDGNGSLERRP